MDKIRVSVFDNRNNITDVYDLPDQMYELAQCWKYVSFISIHKLQSGEQCNCDICHQPIIVDEKGHIK